MAQQGWYPDPRDPRVLRWWDGAAWTERTKACDDGRPSWLRVATVAACSAVVVLGVILLMPKMGDRSSSSSDHVSLAKAPELPSQDTVATIPIQDLVDASNRPDAFNTRYWSEKMKVIGIVGRIDTVDGKRYATLIDPTNENIAIAALTESHVVAGDTISVVCDGATYKPKFGIVAHSCWAMRVLSPHVAAQQPTARQRESTIKGDGVVLWDSEESLEESIRLARTGVEAAYLRHVLRHGMPVKKGTAVRRIEGVFVLRVAVVDTGVTGWVESEFVSR